MNQWMKSIYEGFRDIGMIGEAGSQHDVGRIFSNSTGHNINHIDPSEIVTGCIDSRQLDLVIIDVDTLGVEKARNLIFIASCFIPQTPLVLTTKQKLTQATRRTLYNGRVLGLIEMNESPGVPAAA